MQKAQDLYQHMLATVPELRRDPSKLQMTLKNGAAVATLGPNLGWEYRYRLSLMVLDCADHLNCLIFPALIWLRANEPALLQNMDRAEDGVTFEVDVLDVAAYDVAIEIPLTEAIDVLQNDDGVYEMTHRAEPPIIGVEGNAGLALLPNDIVILLNRFGEALTNRTGQVLTKPRA